MRFYETMFVVKPTLTQEEITTKIDFYKTAIINNGGEISATLDMGMRNLAYEIKKNKRGYYFVIYFKAEPKLVLELERLYRINEDILRFIVIKYDSKKEQKAWEVLVDRAIHNKKPTALKESKDKEPREEKIEDDKEQSPTIEV
ncbi:30S ribosomal protein S6 [Helicobacter apodemus]|uniref:Small ribosomal subunit protein bS6 n=1 Tax=Helicobacter apodemus TaxID=135569 RepID=A0A2U8FEA0_9HELI|nr:30S ribosomal protein S6 [Helicobacter apodemus]AWI34591.1 30S ribosomal protein S6 [Helicobacter apodemus]